MDGSDPPTHRTRQEDDSADCSEESGGRKTTHPVRCNSSCMSASRKISVPGRDLKIQGLRAQLANSAASAKVGQSLTLRLARGS